MDLQAMEKKKLNELDARVRHTEDIQKFISYRGTTLTH